MLLTSLLVTVPALAEEPQCNQPLRDQHPTFCQGSYALCIKAPCKPVEGNAGMVSCSCIVQSGWSMGPVACNDPGRSQPNPTSGTHLMSTYSNNFNTSEHTLTCTSKETRWAWCYGAHCTIDANDSTRATCLCPVCTSPMSTLGGGCHKEACKEVYSAATPLDDKFANTYYYNYLTGQGVSVPPQAESCRKETPPTGH